MEEEESMCQAVTGPVKDVCRAVVVMEEGKPVQILSVLVCGIVYEDQRYCEMAHGTTDATIFCLDPWPPVRHSNFAAQNSTMLWLAYSLN